MGAFFVSDSEGGGNILVKVTKSDLELLKRYVDDGAETAFEEIVRT
jgi:hypothetical protein